MTISAIRKFALAGSGGDGWHAYANGEGAFIGRGVPLLERGPLGQLRPRDKVVLERLLTIGYGAPIDLGESHTRLRHVAEALNKGDLALAGISLVQMQLPPLESAHHAREMAKADGLVAKYNPDWEDEPRVPAGDPTGGEWTSDGESGDGTDHIEPAASRGSDAQARKQRFVDAHLADAERIAARLGVPVENILAVSADESGWGESRFAAAANNFFGIHYPAPFATGFIVAATDGRIATFASYADSARSFAAITGSFVQGISDPQEFATALHRHGFGVGNPNYIHDLARIIRGPKLILSRRTI